MIISTASTTTTYIASLKLLVHLWQAFATPRPNPLAQTAQTVKESCTQLKELNYY